MLFFAGATCTSFAASASVAVSAASAGLASWVLLGATRKREAGSGQQAGETKACQDLLKLPNVHYPPPFQLMIAFPLSSRDRKDLASSTQVNMAYFFTALTNDLP